jgi:hypothetical protein
MNAFNSFNPGAGGGMNQGMNFFAPGPDSSGGGAVGLGGGGEGVDGMVDIPNEFLLDNMVVEGLDLGLASGEGGPGVDQQWLSFMREVGILE